MDMSTSRHKLSRTTLAQYISAQIDLSCKSQIEIAAESGFAKPNMITMIKQGKTPLPMQRLWALATSLEIDPLDLYIRKMEEDSPDIWNHIECNIFKQVFLTQKEIELIRSLRKSHT